MKSVDLFLQDVLNAKIAFNSDDFARDYGYDHGDIIVYMKQIKLFNNNWVAIFQRSEEGPAIFMLDYDYENQIKEFLRSGGFRKIENNEKRKENLEVENLALIKAQQIEIEENKKRQKISIWLSVLAIVISIVTVIVQYMTGE